MSLKARTFLSSVLLQVLRTTAEDTGRLVPAALKDVGAFEALFRAYETCQDPDGAISDPNLGREHRYAKRSLTYASSHLRKLLKIEPTLSRSGDFVTV